MKKTSLVALGLLLILGAAEAFAGGTGGLTKAQGAMDDIKTAVYAIVGSASGLYLIYLGVMAKINKGAWSDFFMGIFYVALVGGSIALGAWAWTMFA